MLVKPAMRMDLSSTSASLATISRQRLGYRKGTMPSITRTKHSATPRSCHTVLTVLKRDNRIAGQQLPGHQTRKLTRYYARVNLGIGLLQTATVKELEEFAIWLNQQHLPFV